MQHCINCGSEVPDDARYCGLCGHEPGRVGTIDKEDTKSDAENGQQPGDVAALSTQELLQSEESKNGKHADDVAALSTQELADSEEVGEVGGVGAVTAGDAAPEIDQQVEDVAALSTRELSNGKKVGVVTADDAVAENEQRAEDVAALSTEGLVDSGGREHVEDSTGSPTDVLEAPEAVDAPPGFRADDRVQIEGEPLQTGADVEGDRAQDEVDALLIPPTSPLPLATPSPQQFPASPAPKAGRRSAVRWVLISVVCILVLAGIVGGLLFFLRSQGTGATTTATPAVGASPTAGSNGGVTPLATPCPKGSSITACITPITGTTPVAGTKAVFNITLTGAVQGPMTVTSMARCGPATSGTEYDLYFSGTVGGTSYNFVARIPAYNGPADYNTGQISVVFAQQPISATTVWGNSGNVPAKATINADLKSGTMDITLASSTNSVHVSGDWVCG